jgi:glycosyltransferase involved in cell wall biosynthesis
MVVVVDDGSTDGTGERATAAGAIVLRHVINLGQGAAIETGITYGVRRSTISTFVTFDADGQHRVEDAIRLVDRLESSGSDIVFGTRFVGDGVKEVPRLRRLLLRMGRIAVNRSSGLKLSDAHNGLRAFNRSVATELRFRHYGMAHASEVANIVGKIGFKVAEEPVVIRYTDFSMMGGQSATNAVNIMFDLFWRR